MRVLVRVKPKDSFEDEFDSTIRIREEDDATTLFLTKPWGNRPENLKYQFDRILGPTADQSAIFEEVAPFISSFIDGVNVCMFAYGQSSSGKTYTMEGPNSDMLYEEEKSLVHEQSGILPRAAVLLVSEITKQN
jgi:hypothetical protein